MTEPVYSLPAPDGTQWYPGRVLDDGKKRWIVESMTFVQETRRVVIILLGEDDDRRYYSLLVETPRGWALAFPPKLSPGHGR